MPLERQFWREIFLRGFLAENGQREATLSVLFEKGLDFKAGEHAVQRAPVDIQYSRATRDVPLIVFEDMQHVTLLHLFKSRRIGKKELFIVRVGLKRFRNRIIAYSFR